MTDQLVAQHSDSDTTPAALVTKIAVVIRDDLPVWQKLNMTAFLASGVAASASDAIGAGVRRRGRHALLADVRTTGDGVRGRRWSPRAHPRAGAVSRSRPTIFTTALFFTGNDVANRAAVAAVPRANLDLAGIAIRADRKTVDKITAGLRLHP